MTEAQLSDQAASFSPNDLNGNSILSQQAHDLMANQSRSGHNAMDKGMAAALAAVAAPAADTSADAHLPKTTIIIDNKPLAQMTTIEKSQLIQSTFKKIENSDQSSIFTHDSFSKAAAADAQNLSPNEQKAAQFIDNNFGEFRRLKIATTMFVNDDCVENLVADTAHPKPYQGLGAAIGGATGVLAFGFLTPMTLGGGLIPMVASDAVMLYGANKLLEQRAARSIDAKLATDLR